MRYLSKLDLKKFRGKTCLLRIDLNVDGNKKDSLRFKAVIPTIKLLLKNKIRVLILSHLGRPARIATQSVAGGPNQKFTLHPFVKILSNKLEKDVKFISLSNDFEKIKRVVKTSKNQVFLLENLRFWPGEVQNDPKFARKLAILGDFCVNEAFPVSHRKNASISAITRFLPSYLGLRFEEEIDNLSPFLKVQKRPFALILGGVKVGDKLGVINYFLEKADYFLLGGGPANTFLRAMGLPVGNSLIDKNYESRIKKYLNSKKFLLPLDTKIKNREILDIGERTVEEYGKIIKKSRVIIWAGPMGYYQKKGFENGTKGIWKAVLANRKAQIAVGGGETIASLKLLGNRKLAFRNKNVFLSTGGGAMLEFLSGKKFPGILN